MISAKNKKVNRNIDDFKAFSEDLIININEFMKSKKINEINEKIGFKFESEIAIILNKYKEIDAFYEEYEIIKLKPDNKMTYIIKVFLEITKGLRSISDIQNYLSSIKTTLNNELEQYKFNLKG